MCTCYLRWQDADLERAARLPGAGDIQALDDAPGGGRLVTITDPDGFPVNIIFGQEAKEAGSNPNKLPLNYGMEKERARKFQRFQTGPAATHKVRCPPHHWCYHAGAEGRRAY